MFNLFKKPPLALATAKEPKNTLQALSGVATLEKAMIQLSYTYDTDEVLRQAGKTRADLRLLETDDEILSALETRRDAVLNTPWRIEHPQARARTFFTQALTPVMHQIITALWQAVPYGYAVIELVYSTDSNGKIIPVQVISVPFEWINPQQDGRMLWATDQSECDARKFFGVVRNQTIKQPHGEPLLSRAYWPFVFRKHGWQFWMKYLERAGVPFLVGKTDGDKTAALNALANAVQDAVIVAGSNDSIEALDFGRDPKIFTEFEIAVTRRIQKLILGQTLTSGTDGGSGNRALGEVHNSVREEKKRADLRLITQTIQNIINTIAQLNGLTPATIIMEDAIGLETARSERDVKLATAGMVQFTQRYFEEKYGLEPDDFVVMADTATQSTQTASLSTKATLTLANNSEPFTPAQQAIEDIADNAIQDATQPIDVKAIQHAISLATDPDDLTKRLSELMNERDPHFQAVLAQAIFTADVVGYVANKKGMV